MATMVTRTRFTVTLYVLFLSSIYFNFVISCRLMASSTNWPLLFRVFPQIFCCHYPSPRCVLHDPPPPTLLYNRPNSSRIWQYKLCSYLLCRFLQAPCCFICLRSKYSSSDWLTEIPSFRRKTGLPQESAIPLFLASVLISAHVSFNL